MGEKSPPHKTSRSCLCGESLSGKGKKKTPPEEKGGILRGGGRSCVKDGVTLRSTGGKEGRSMYQQGERKETSPPQSPIPPLLGEGGPRGGRGVSRRHQGSELLQKDSYPGNPAKKEVQQQPKGGRGGGEGKGKGRYAFC